MGIFSRTADTYYSYRFLSTLVTKWEDMDAYKLGIIDADGKNIRKSRTLSTTEEKSAYTLFHRLVFNIKRLLEKLPTGKSRIASYAAALFLLKEHKFLTEEEISKVLEEIGQDIDHVFDESLAEYHDYKIVQEYILAPGKYSLNEDIADKHTGNVIAVAGSEVIVHGNCTPADTIFGEYIYEVTHKLSNTKIFVTSGDVGR